MNTRLSPESPDKYGFVYPLECYAPEDATSTQKKKFQWARQRHRLRKYKKMLSGCTRRPALFAEKYQAIYAVEGPHIQQSLRRYLDRGNNAVTDKRIAS